MSMRDQIAAWLAQRDMQAQQDAAAAGIPPLSGAMYPPELAPPPGTSMQAPPPMAPGTMQRPLPPVPPLTGAMYPKKRERRE